MHSPTLLLLAALVLLSGCATAPSQSTGVDAPWEERSQRLEQIDNWQVEGKLALRNAGQSESANLLWRQRGENSELQLSGPLGMAATRISSDGKTLNIQRGDEYQQLDVSSPMAVQLNTGWDLPLAALPYWLRGIPQPGSEPSEIRIKDQLLRSLTQGGWQVQFERYSSFDSFTLPTHLRVQRGDTSVRLVIRQWLTGADL